MPIAPSPYATPAKILLPMDFSDSSYSALDMAGDLAQRCHAQLHLVHIISEAPVFTGVDYFPETAVLEEAVLSNDWLTVSPHSLQRELTLRSASKLEMT